MTDASDTGRSYWDRAAAVYDRSMRVVECLERDLHAHGLPDASVDAVLCANVLHLVPDLDAALRVLVAPLRPGGKLVAPTYAHGENALARTISTVAAVFGFPVRRRLSTASLAEALRRHGLEVRRAEVIAARPFPMAFVTGVRA